MVRSSFTADGSSRSLLAIPVLRRLKCVFRFKGDIASSEVRNEAGDIFEAAEPFGGGVSLHTRCDMSEGMRTGTYLCRQVIMTGIASEILFEERTHHVRVYK